MISAELVNGVFGDPALYVDFRDEKRALLFDVGQERVPMYVVLEGEVEVVHPRPTVEALITVLAIHHQVSPPTMNIITPDPACDLDYVANTAREMKIEVAISNSFGFGGTNGTLAFRRLR